MEKKTYNLDEAAEVIGVCRHTVRKLIEAKELHALKPSKRRYIIPIEAVNRYLNADRR